MAQVTGRAFIRVDGQELRSTPGATLSIGGSNRTAVTGSGRVHGYREEDVAPEVSFSVAHTADLSISWLNNITNATVLFETDTGRRFVLRQAFTTAPPELNSQEGTVSVAMSAIECDED